MSSKLEELQTLDVTKTIETTTVGLYPSTVSSGIDLGLSDPVDQALLRARASDNSVSENKHYPPSDSFSDRLLAAHNKYRSEVGVPPLNWSQTLANSAKKAANQQVTNFGHTRDSGESIWGGTSGAYSLTQIVDDWGSEKKKFIPGRPFSKKESSTTGNWHDIGHYTQMVWENTKEVGCGLTSGGGNDYLVCHYNPPGNRFGQKVYSDKPGPSGGSSQQPSQWIKVKQAGIKSHSSGGAPWCPNGSFINAIDLDAAPTSAHDSPVIGAVSCGRLAGAESNSWATSPRWIKVGQAGINSHSSGGAPWCPNGSFITQIDLDAARLSAHDSPVIGQVRCASLAGHNRWSSTTDWREIGPVRSHNQSGSWCPSGSFITQIDLDGASLSAHDSPVIGRVKCSYPAP